MEQRVAYIKTNNPLPHVDIDVIGLEQEHFQQRRRELQKALNKSPIKINWEHIAEENKKLLNY